MKLLKTLLALSATAFIAHSAQANQIDGTVGFFDPNGAHLAFSSGHQSASGVTTTVTVNNPASVNFTTGDYSAVANGTAVTFNSVSFTGVGVDATLTAALTPFITIAGPGGFTFDLLSLTSASALANNPSNFSLSGFGTAHGTGFEDTVASFALQGTGRGLTLTFFGGSVTSIPSVPDSGSAVSLFGIGLMAIEGLRRKFLKA